MTDEVVSEQAPRRPRFAVMRRRSYFAFWLTALISNTGMWMSNLTVPVILYAITGSAVWVGAFTLFNFLPTIVLGPIAGVIADRFDRRHVLLLSQIGMLATSIGLLLMWLGGVDSPWLIMIPVLVNGALSAVNTPAFLAFVHDLVPRELLRSAVNYNSIQFNLARALGPVSAGFILATSGPGWALAVNCLSFIPLILVLIFVRLNEPQVLVKSAQRILKQFGSALRYIKGASGIELAIIGSVIGGLLGQPIFSMSIVLAHKVYHVGAMELGLLNMYLSLGAISVIPLLAGKLSWFPLSRAMSWGVAGTAVGFIGLTLTSNYYVASFLFFFTGAALILIMAGSATVVQMIVRNDMRGRVLSVRQMMFMGAIPIGAMTAGYIADHVGVQVFLLGAGILMLIALVLMYVIPTRGMKSLDDPHDEGVEQ